MQERRNLTLLLAVLPTIALIFALAGFALGWQVFGRGAPGSSAAGLSKVRTALSRIDARYYPGVSSEVLLDGALEGIAGKLDPYCEYFTAKQYQSFKEMHLTGQFGGVGIRVTLDRASGYVAVETPIEDSPAFAADILPGDQIREVNGWSTKGRELTEVISKIKGEPDTSVILTMARKGRDPFKVSLVRKIIVVKAVKARLLEGGVGYVRISDFTEMMGLFDKAVAKLREEGAKAFIVDLRFNGGGLLSECVTLSDRFLAQGVIVSIKGKTKEDGRDYPAQKGDALEDLPLVVLVNEGSASASEIFTGAMKDHKRGVIVGSRTYGKGSVQTPFELPDGSHLKLTTARYYTPNGTSVHREEGKKEFGIEPDLRVEMSQEEYAQLMKRWNDEEILKGTKPAAAPGDFKDLQLEAGLEVLRAKLAGREPKVEPRVLGARKAETED